MGAEQLLGAGTRDASGLGISVSLGLLAEGTSALTAQSLLCMRVFAASLFWGPGARGLGSYSCLYIHLVPDFLIDF